MKSYYAGRPAPANKVAQHRIMAVAIPYFTKYMAGLRRDTSLRRPCFTQAYVVSAPSANNLVDTSYARQTFVSDAIKTSKLDDPQRDQ